MKTSQIKIAIEVVKVQKHLHSYKDKRKWQFVGWIVYGKIDVRVKRSARTAINWHLSFGNQQFFHFPSSDLGGILLPYYHNCGKIYEKLDKQTLRCIFLLQAYGLKNTLKVFRICTWEHLFLLVCNNFSKGFKCTRLMDLN